MQTQHVQPIEKKECLITSAYQILNTAEDLNVTNKLRQYRDDFLKSHTTNASLVAKYYEFSERYVPTMLATNDTEFARNLIHVKIPAFVEAIEQANHDFVVVELEALFADVETRFTNTAHSA
jgi:rRNA-processing protein FCF1